MAQSWSTEVLDGSLNVLSAQADRMTLCAGAPASYAEATTVYPTGKMLAQVDIDSGDWTLAAGDPDGRQTTLAAQQDGSAEASGTADHIAIVEDGASKLLAVDSLSAGQVITLGNPVVFAAFRFVNRALTLLA
jgi:hypothetical protein